MSLFTWGLTEEIALLYVAVLELYRAAGTGPVDQAKTGPLFFYYMVAKLFSNMFRYIDDLLTLNNPTFEQEISNIYPQ